jgi:putative endonuclease
VPDRPDPDRAGRARRAGVPEGAGVLGWLWKRRAARVGDTPTRLLGRRGERAATRFLKAQGYRVLSRNLRLGVGEIDLLAEAPDARTIVVVEVKARVAGPRAGADDGPRLPERAITAAKGRKLAQLARAVKARRGVASRPVRIDVVAVEFPSGGAGRGVRPEIRHYPNAIDAQGRRV